MAKRFECDACGEIVELGKAMIISVHDRYASGAQKDKIHEIDVCPRCYKNLCELLHLEVKVHVE